MKENKGKREKPNLAPPHSRHARWPVLLPPPFPFSGPHNAHFSLPSPPRVAHLCNRKPTPRAPASRGPAPSREGPSLLSPSRLAQLFPPSRRTSAPRSPQPTRAPRRPSARMPLRRGRLRPSLPCSRGTARALARWSAAAMPVRRAGSPAQHARAPQPMPPRCLTPAARRAPACSLPEARQPRPRSAHPVAPMIRSAKCMCA
jgi:hypothetical protein